MGSRILADFLDRERVAGLQGVDRHVLRAVVLERATHVRCASDQQQVAEEYGHLDGAFHDALDDAALAAGDRRCEQERREEEQPDTEHQRETEHERDRALAEVRAVDRGGSRRAARRSICSIVAGHRMGGQLGRDATCRQRVGGGALCRFRHGSELASGALRRHAGRLRRNARRRRRLGRLIGLPRIDVLRRRDARRPNEPAGPDHDRLVEDHEPAHERQARPARCPEAYRQLLVRPHDPSVRVAERHRDHVASAHEDAFDERLASVREASHR